MDALQGTSFALLTLSRRAHNLADLLFVFYQDSLGFVRFGLFDESNGDEDIFPGSIVKARLGTPLAVIGRRITGRDAHGKAKKTSSVQSASSASTILY